MVCQVRTSLDDLVREVASDNGITMTAAKAIITSVFSRIKILVSAGDQVSITKFGSFTSMRSRAYTARNPKTGEPVKVPAKNRVRFHPYSSFKEMV